MLYGELCSASFAFTNVFANYSLWKEQDAYDYESQGRVKNLLYYQISGSRGYYRSGTPLVTLTKSDILFIPEGCRYYTDVPTAGGAGIGISFDLLTPGGEPLRIKEDLRLLHSDGNGALLRHCQNVLFCINHPGDCTLMLNCELFQLFSALFSEPHTHLRENKAYMDLKPAIDAIELTPEISYSTGELAKLCFISESTFLRKFKQFSGGATPVQYRNNIRFMMAEELVGTSKSLSEIAELLGFYDAAHLCHAYRREKGKTLKKS